MAKTNYSVLVEIRDLLKSILGEKKKAPQNVKAKPQLKPAIPKPTWGASAFPIERFKVGTTKNYPFADREVLIRRIKHVNRKMKTHFHLPNHFRYRTTMTRGRLYITVWRDK